MIETISVGDLVRFEPWDCEGVEMPYGFKEHVSLWDSQKQKMREDFRKKIKIEKGSTGFVTEILESKEDTHESRYFWCVSGSSRLLVPHIFIHKIQ